MSIILNEYEWAEDMIARNDLGKNPLETLTRVSKYYFANNHSYREVRNLMDLFMVRCNPNVILIHWSDTLDKIVKSSAKRPLIQLDGISITQPELQRVDELESVQLRRLAFTLLCVAKYWDAVRTVNNHWVNTSDKEIMKMANINAPIKKQSFMFADLKDADLIRFSRRIDNLNVQVTFMEDGDEALYIQDFRNLGYQYMRRFGGSYFECANCGLVVKAKPSAKGRPQKYCSACAMELATKSSVNSVMRHRNELKN